jgi:hypothetical protein
MKILYRDSKIIGTADDSYTGPELFTEAPVGFSIDAARFYEIVDGNVVFKANDYAVERTQARLDVFANTRGYDGVNSASKYKDITDAEIATLPVGEQQLVTKFRTECRYLTLVTARTWASLYLILDQINAGHLQPPSSFEELEMLLPVLEWPA